MHSLWSVLLSALQTFHHLRCKGVVDVTQNCIQFERFFFMYARYKLFTHRFNFSFQVFPEYKRLRHNSKLYFFFNPTDFNQWKLFFFLYVQNRTQNVAVLRRIYTRNKKRKQIQVSTKTSSCFALCRLPHRAVLRLGAQPDVSGPAHRHRVHKDFVLRHSGTGLGSPLRDVPGPASALPQRVHTKPPHRGVPR